MKADIVISNKSGVYHCFTLCFKDTNCHLIHVDGFICLRAYKIHNHSYEFSYFLYKTLYIGFRQFNSFKEMYGAVQKLLKEVLYDVEQKL